MSTPRAIGAYLGPAEIGRRIASFVLAWIVRAYAAAAAVSVALSGSEALGGKARDALGAVSHLTARYHEAMALIAQRERIEHTLNYVAAHAPSAKDLEASTAKAATTLQKIDTTYREVTSALTAVKGIRPTNIATNVTQANDHINRALSAKPSQESLAQLADQANGGAALLREVGGLNIDFAAQYANLIRILDNFSRDEIGATLTVMLGALVVGYLSSHMITFWGRRGRPGLITMALTNRGSRRYDTWYSTHLKRALGTHLYAVARQRIQADLVTDPRAALSTEEYARLATHFASPDTSASD